MTYFDTMQSPPEQRSRWKTQIVLHKKKKKNYIFLYEELATIMPEQINSNMLKSYLACPQTGTGLPIHWHGKWYYNVYVISTYCILKQ